MHLLLGKEIARRISQIYPEGKFDLRTVKRVNIEYIYNEILSTLPDGDWVISGAEDGQGGKLLKGTLNDWHTFKDGKAVVEDVYLGDEKEVQAVTAHQVNVQYSYCRDSAMALLNTNTSDPKRREFNGLIVYQADMASPDLNVRWNKIPNVDVVVQHGVIFFGNYGQDMIDMWEYDRNFLKSAIDIKDTGSISSTFTKLFRSGTRGYINDKFYIEFTVEHTERLSDIIPDEELQKGGKAELEGLSVEPRVISKA